MGSGTFGRRVKVWGLLAQTFGDAMRLWDVMKRDGVPLSERQRHLRKALAAAWPEIKPPRFACETCSDLGLLMWDCPGDLTCGRRKPHLPHAFGKPCECPAGVKFKAKQKAAADYTVAAKVRQPTRVSR